MYTRSSPSLLQIKSGCIASTSAAVTVCSAPKFLSIFFYRRTSSSAITFVKLIAILIDSFYIMVSGQKI